MACVKVKGCNVDDFIDFDINIIGQSITISGYVNELMEVRSNIELNNESGE